MKLFLYIHVYSNTGAVYITIFTYIIWHQRSFTISSFLSRFLTSNAYALFNNTCMHQSTYMHASANTHACMHASINMHAYINQHACMHQTTYMHQSTCMHVSSNMHASINLHACINQHSCMCKSINQSINQSILIKIIFWSVTGQLSDRLKFSAGQNKNLQDRKSLTYYITKFYSLNASWGVLGILIGCKAMRLMP